MNERHSHIDQRETQPRRERMPEQELGNLLAAIGNHEGKALLLAGMTTERAYTSDELYSVIISSQGEKKGWKTNRTVPYYWCSYSLSPIGLVAREVVDQEHALVRYRKTDYGSDIGTALAGHLLSFSEEHPDVSLYQLFGATISPSKDKSAETKDGEITHRNRAPLTRFRIFYELLSRDLPMRSADLADSFNDTNSIEYKTGDHVHRLIQSHLQQLAKTGVITYASTEYNRSFSAYSVSPDRPNDKPAPYKTSVTLTRDVYTMLEAHPDTIFTSDALYEKLVKQNPQRETLNKRSFSSTISKVLNNLTEQGYVVKGKFGNGIQSEITLSDSQKAALTDLVVLIDRFSEMDEAFLKEGCEIAKEILNDPSRVACLMEKAKNASPHANQTDRQESEQRIISYLLSHPGSTTRDIQKALKEKYNKSLTAKGIQIILRNISQREDMQISQRGSQNYYTIERREEDPETVVFDAQKN